MSKSPCPLVEVRVVTEAARSDVGHELRDVGRVVLELSRVEVEVVILVRTTGKIFRRWIGAISVADPPPRQVERIRTKGPETSSPLLSPA